MKKLAKYAALIAASFLLGAVLASNGAIDLSFTDSTAAADYRTKAQDRYGELITDLKEQFLEVEHQLPNEADKRRLKVKLAKIEMKVARLQEVHPFKWKDFVRSIDEDAENVRESLGNI